MIKSICQKMNILNLEWWVKSRGTQDLGNATFDRVGEEREHRFQICKLSAISESRKRSSKGISAISRTVL